MFQMYRECFALLCDKIKQAVGESMFKSEEYIGALLSYPGRIHFVNMAAFVEYVCLEIYINV